MATHCLVKPFDHLHGCAVDDARTRQFLEQRYERFVFFGKASYFLVFQGIFEGKSEKVGDTVLSFLEFALESVAHLGVFLSFVFCARFVSFVRL